MQAFTVPAEMREIRALEQHLCLQTWGKFLVEDELTFIIEDDCEVKDSTLSFRRAEHVKVAPALAQYDAADFLCAPCTAPAVEPLMMAPKRHNGGGGLATGGQQPATQEQPASG